MYKVLIAEDELFVRLGIKNSVRWEDYDMEVVADVKDGQAAWRMMEELRPDILITDVLMPAMDGKQLVKLVSQIYADVYIVVISCLEDFETVQQLLHNGIKDYLLKSTMTEEQIMQSLQKARDFLGKHRDGMIREDAPSRMERQELALRQFLSGEISARELCGRLRLDRALTEAPFVLAVCTIDAIYESDANSAAPAYRSITRNALDLLSNRTYPPLRHQALAVDERRLLLLFYSPVPAEADREVFRQTALRMNSDIRDFCSLHMSFRLLCVPGGMNDLRSSCLKSIQAAQRHYLGEAGAVLCSWDEEQNGIEGSRAALLAHRAAITRYLDAAHISRYDDLLEELPQRVAESREEMIFIFKSILSLFRPWLGDEDGAGLSDALERCNRSIEAIPFLVNCTAAICEFLEQWEQTRTAGDRNARPEIRQALRFMEERLADASMTLSTVAAHVGLSETYFSALFRQETGIPFIKCLCNLRVERAKGLLRSTNSKIITIAAQAGFSDDTYFSRVFKKATGASPSEWRCQWQR